MLSAAEARETAHSPAAEHALFGQMPLACALMVASGFAGLAYQIVWTQQSTAWLGHESAAVLAVVAAFFGGLALGALALSSRIERSSRPERWYAGCEVTIGAWSIVLALLLKPASGALLTLIGPQPSALWHWSVAFLGTFLLLLPATLAMGATLPAMERVLATARTHNAAISTLYAANTFGAVVGVLAAAFWLVPQLGLVRSAIACALLNFGCAATALSLQTVTQERSQAQVTGGSNVTLAQLAITGLLGIGYEVLIVRALSQIAENTVYTFALLLAVYLIGTAVGAAIYARWLVNASEPDRMSSRLLQALSAACVISTLSLASAENIKQSWLAAFGMSMPTALTAEAAIAVTAFFLPTLIMGALFSHLSTDARASGISFGRAIGVNTLGAAVAPFLFGVVLLPLLGLKPALLLISIGYLMLVTRRAWSAPLQWTLAAAIVGCVVWTPSLQTAQVPEGGRLVAYIEGVMASVSVIEDAAGVATLHIDNRQQEGSSATLLADARQALLPILLHPEPKRVLFLGVGTGLTSSSATIDPEIHVDAVELVPEVISATSHFESAFAANADRSRLHLMSADARRFVRTSEARYDVIVSDNFHPARSGSASLYTVEHFASVRERLAEGGLFCQWLPLHQLDLDTLRSIVRSYMAVYSHGSALLATLSLDTPTIGLISRRDGEPFDLEQVRQRIASAQTFGVREFGFTDELPVLGSFIAGSQFLKNFAGGAPLNTDDRPIVAYRAPDITYVPSSSPRDRLVELLRDAQIGPAELLGKSTEAESTRLSAYWTARNQFIAAGLNVRPSPDVREMLAQVQEPLLNVLHTSPEFRPAYDPLLRMAAALTQIDRDAARALLRELQQAQPARPEAGEILRGLTAE